MAAGPPGGAVVSWSTGEPFNPVEPMPAAWRGRRPDPGRPPGRVRRLFFHTAGPRPDNERRGGHVHRHDSGGNIPKDNRNAWKQGRYAAEAMAGQRWMRGMLRRYNVPWLHGNWGIKCIDG
jgi:hypothetical protein